MLLVAAQMLAVGWLVLQAISGLRADHPPLDALLTMAAGLMLGLWAVTANRPGNFNIHPMPREGGQLVSNGPYRWVRHPMYSALLLAGLGAARLAAEPVTWAVLVALAAVLWAKSTIEERAMAAAHPGYADYQRRTRRFVPGLFYFTMTPARHLAGLRQDSIQQVYQ